MIQLLTFLVFGIVDVNGYKNIEEAMKEWDYKQMMHLKLDIETLQKISC